MFAVAALALALGLSTSPSGTVPPSAPQSAHPQAEAQALDLAMRSIALRSVRGPNNQTPAVAALYRDVLLKAGFAPDDVSITPVDDTAYLIARWRGRDPTARPLVISGHMDVVEANPSDWKRDPFTPVVENGYLFGRGATDMKLDGALAIAALIELRREGYAPRRDVIIEFSGDEETTMKTSALIAAELEKPQVVINIDGGGGTLEERSGRPLYYVWGGAEKTYSDFELTVTNPGGHSSQPRRVNAITELSAALVRIGAHRFRPEVNALTRQSLASMAPYEGPVVGPAMRAFAQNPADEGAIAVLEADPAMVGRIGTTCVVTMISGGHALNALPQKASANINCRIFPGHRPGEIMAELKAAAADPAIAFTDVTAGSVATDASPERPDVVQAITHAVALVYPGTPVFPGMASGASDCMWFRHAGADCYAASPIFIKNSDDFAHGLNERTPVANVGPAVTYYLSLFSALAN